MLQLIVDRYVTTLVRRKTGSFQVQVVGVRSAANGQENVRAGDMRLSFVALQTHGYLAAAAFKVNAVGVQSHLNAFGVKNSADHLRRVFIFMRTEARVSVDNGDLGPKTAEHLREFQSHITAANNDEVSGEFFEVQDRGAGEEGD